MCGRVGTYEDVVAMPVARRVEFIDRCISGLVAALNAGGVVTVASCCGHGRCDGSIILEDGRELVIRKFDPANHVGEWEPPAQKPGDVCICASGIGGDTGPSPDCSRCHGTGIVPHPSQPGGTDPANPRPEPGEKPEAGGAPSDEELPIVAASFRIDELVRVLLRERFAEWRTKAVIIPHYIPPHADKDTKPKCVVRIGENFLRHSAGPRQGHFWDMYGDDYLTPELAFFALLEADPPHCMFRRDLARTGEEK